MPPRKAKRDSPDGESVPRPAAGEDIALASAPGAERPRLLEVLKSAAKLQQAAPDAVLVGGTAAALWASHRDSADHDHVLDDLSVRFDAVLEAVERTDGWITNRVTPKKI